MSREKIENENFIKNFMRWVKKSSHFLRPEPLARLVRRALGVVELQERAHARCSWLSDFQMSFPCNLFNQFNAEPGSSCRGPERLPTAGRCL
ncbi:hypothetical protein [Cohaesibacter sp. ES.047]|uniref:hypothetical protein n=1 Tax=Cohaesibacter sp. ES.047 TaxID=1798205 RepID=UPI0012FE376D|nr:hypothetical protein [Cohaesibacter sp. ES.047]